MSQDQDKINKRKHKYDVWISKESKKNLDILENILDLRLIIDWAAETNADIFKYSFKEAFDAQRDWHNDMMLKYKISRMEIPEIENDRVVFRFSDKKHFLYLLVDNDLKREGSSMGHCVGGKNYKSKVKNKHSIILSIRDESNMPHLTVEIDVKSKTVVQKYGKGNKQPISKYLDMYGEYALYASGFKDIKNKEVLKFLNLNFTVNNI